MAVRKVKLKSVTVHAIDEKIEYILITRTKADFSGEAKLVNFMGEPYPASAITMDFDFIKRVFIEFWETGNVSHESMSL